MRVFAAFFIGIQAVSAVTHSLQYFYTTTSLISDFPSFVIVGMVDKQQMMYYDSAIKKAIPKQEWMAKSEGPDYWERNTQIAIGNEQSSKNDINIVQQRFNQTGGVHTVQQMYGCEWDDGTEVTDGFRQFGYDGEDFISLDLKNMVWVAPVQQAFITKQKWNSDRAELEYLKNYHTQICIEWLKKYVDYGKSSLQRKVPPTVSLLQKDPSSPVTCHATGFYPNRVVISWQKEGKDLNEDVEIGEVLPNDDGTFQQSARLTVKPEEWETGKYECVVQHPSDDKNIIILLNKSVIKTNQESNMAVIIGCVVVIGVLVLLAITGVVVWKNKKGYQKAGTTDKDTNSNSGNSDTPALKA